MNINRHNYEEFFLLYVDNELDTAGRAAVENFIAANPDLAIELEMLQDTVLPSDSNLHFTGKEALLKNELLINELNHEELFLLYHDNELTLEQKEKVEQFVYRHPQFQQEFELIREAQLVPDNSIRFPDKNTLYRSEKEKPIIAFRWWRIAAAAVVVLFLGVSGWYYRSTSSITDPALAVDGPKTTVPAIAPKNDTMNHAEQMPQEQLTQQLAETKKETKELPQSVLTNNTAKSNENLIAYTTPVPDTKKIIDEPRNIPATSNVTIIETPEKGTIALNEANPTTNLQRNERRAETVIDGPVGGEEEEEKGLSSYAVNDGSIEVMNTNISNKTKMRGFLRKVSRVMEKATSFGPGENENRKGIRIANFEIPLK